MQIEISKKYPDNDMSSTVIVYCSRISEIMREMIDTIADRILNSLKTAVHSICHWFVYYLMSRKEPTTCNNSHAIIASIKTRPCIAPQHIVFLSISEKLRHIHLLKPRSRGSSDDFILIAS